MSTAGTTIVEAIREIALTDPISTVLFLIGGLITGGSVAIFGGLTLGAVAEFVTPG